MKKIFTIVSFATLLFAACSKEEVAPVERQENLTPGTYLFTLKANLDNPEETKTSYAGEQTFSWSAGDQISVLFHKDDDNRFFTLTTTGTGASVMFSGEITSGYTIGSSNDAAEKIALYPAGAHYYDRTKAKYHATDNPKRGAFFNIPAVTDFTKSHVSANLPMAAIGDGENVFAFKHIAGMYKVVFSSIDPSVTKVKLHVKNQVTRALSGDFRLEDGGSHYYTWWWTSASEGSEGQTVSYVVNVDPSTHKASFYIPYSHGDGEGFQPTFTLTNAVNGNTLAIAQAKAPFSGDHAPSYSHIVVMPEIPASGTGTAPAWKSNHEINWDMVDTSVGGRTSENFAGINQMKVTSDADNLYILLDIKTSYLVDNAAYQNSNYFILYMGDGSDSGSGTWMWEQKYQNVYQGWLKTGNAVTYTATDGEIVDAIANISGEHCYYEIAFPRSGHSALLGTSAIIGCVFDKRYKEGGVIKNDPDQGDTYVGYAPAPWTPMMSITLPEYGTNPPTALPANHSFTEADGDIANPERGFYKHFEYKFDGGSTPSTTIASYTFEEPLVLTIFYLRDYRTSDHLSEAVLNKFNAEMNATRAKGKKAIVRFAYTWLDETPHDPSPEQVINHLDDLAPYFAAHEDVIYLVQAGFIGTYGEWYYKDTDFKWTLSGSTLSNYSNASSVITKMLAVVPESRQIALRTSFYKRWYLYPSAINTVVPDIVSWGSTPNQRIGYYNDGFRGSSNDIGTFESDQDRTQWYGQGQWLVCGGESAYVGTDSDHNGKLDPEEKQAWINANPTLANPDNSIAAMKQQHFSYLHYAASNILMDYWAGPGGDVSCGANRMPDFQKALGYRLVLGDVSLSGDLTSGSTVTYSIAIRNKGCARVIYPRPCQLVLIHNGTATVVKDNLTDVRNLVPGADATVIEGSFILPQNVYKNDALAIWLPDNDVDLRDTPAYSIHLANSDITWDEGYNIIHTF